MKKIFKYTMIAVMTAFMASCSSNDDNNTSSDDNKKDAKEAALLVADQQFVTSTVVPTYKGLADACEKLQETIEGMKSQADLEKACLLWKDARQYWEWSEAFLFGAASGYGIDPHIDTWPFDQVVFNNHMDSFDPENEASVAKMEEVVATGQNLTGFHALEYLIFREGKARNLSDLQEKEKVYAALVAADLYLSAVRLEAAWAGIDNVSKARQELLEEAEMEPEDNFGYYMSNAGKAGSKYSTATLGAIQIIEGCKDIADEVASAKIGKPALGEDVTYIESPNAYNSIVDFADNIRSCQFALYGGLNKTTPQAGSIMAYAQTNCPEQYNLVKSTIETAIAKTEAMKAPFVIYYNDSSAKAAIEAIRALDDALSELENAIK